MGLIERSYNLLLAHRLAALLVAVGIAASLASFASFEIDTSLEIWFLEDDPDVMTYDAYVERFETDEFIAIALVAEDVFEPETLDDVVTLSERLGEELPHVVRVSSLANAETIRLDGDTLRVERVLDGVPTDPEALEALRERVHGDRMLADLVSEADDAILVLVEHRPFDDLQEKGDFATAARRIAESVRGDAYRAAGNAFVDEATQAYTKRDLAVIAPATGVMILLITFVLFRNVWCTIVPTVVIGLTLASAIGLAGILGVKLNIITTIVIPLAMAVGVADTVHIIAAYRERLEHGLDQHEAMRSAWIELLFPCVITTATTAAGLASLVAANLTPIRQFGWMGAATVIFALFYTLILIPVIFSWVPPPMPARRRDNPLMTRVLGGVADFAWGRNRAVLAMTAALVVLSAIGTTRLVVGADFASYFRNSDPVFLDVQYIDRHLGGTGGVDIMVDADDVRDPAVLGAMLAIQDRLKDNAAILSTDSPATLVQTLHERYFGDPDRFRVPDELPAVAQLLSQSEGSVVHESLMLVDYSAARVRARVRSSDYRALVEQMLVLEQATADAFDGVATAKVTGVGKLIANLDTYIIRSQIRSFLLAFATVALLLGLFFRSVHVGVWALVPNALPILIVLGAMGWFGILLDVGTVMIASIMLGLIVDDTVHYLARYRLEFARLGHPPNEDERRGMARRTGVGTGRAITTTSVILVCGFWISLAASFKPSINFGMMCGFATIAALICDLVALPAVIRAWPLDWKRAPQAVAPEVPPAR